MIHADPESAMPAAYAATPFAQRLGLTLPVVQAPMAGVSTPALAAAVSNAGGLGSLGLGAMNADAARQAIALTREQTMRPFNVNLFCHAPATADAAREARWLQYLAPRFAEFDAQPPATLREVYTSFLADDDMFDMLLAERPEVVSLHFGLPPASRIAALRQAGIYLMATATDMREAARIAAAGVDAIVAQGIEAGGHRGMFDPAARDEQLGPLALTRLLARRFDAPVIAAGGIMDGAGVAAVLALGAQAAQLGTAFISCPESSADMPHRHALLDQAEVATTLTRAISGRPARSIANRYTELGAAADCPPTPDYPIAYDAGKALHAAARARGDASYAAQWAGQATALSRGVPAATLMRQLQAELNDCIGRLAR
ncbi:NAD(P)H-dependent flavin oxidoreductase [Bordetella parapertussis]|uniref:NAD(P)H-dependent flavin oxidoreductase n=1 Tax=Bordetella parapertussis TaxID=519 RepID=UPI0012987F8A|nr:nitronate monooxygenase [Bordetella parapertussis]QGA90356.1 nitronate monooxygenase [Bordetella parapertussis]QGA98760.1 nitronate monooxygenase [Bordetella parapertussis]QGB10333.1 nitronate monooxygenase [Bordetella parapertussis]QGB17749.1 nitronate monooxygenase [Bordetella parapertussis]QGB26238.1 nitronate monooxygenase [Bordetella parapertussis]